MLLRSFIYRIAKTACKFSWDDKRRLWPLWLMIFPSAVTCFFVRSTPITMQPAPSVVGDGFKNVAWVFVSSFQWFAMAVWAELFVQAVENGRTFSPSRALHDFARLGGGILMSTLITSGRLLALGVAAFVGAVVAAVAAIFVASFTDVGLTPKWVPSTGLASLDAWCIAAGICLITSFLIFRFCTSLAVAPCYLAQGQRSPQSLRNSRLFVTGHRLSICGTYLALFAIGTLPFALVQVVGHFALDMPGLFFINIWTKCLNFTTCFILDTVLAFLPPFMLRAYSPTRKQGTTVSPPWHGGTATFNPASRAVTPS